MNNDAFAKLKHHCPAGVTDIREKVIQFIAIKIVLKFTIQTLPERLEKKIYIFQKELSASNNIMKTL